ncbi:MerR family transcriptional regulator [Motiliproteus sp. MSK22-1]|uniref:MerR family transcriptional regulator n=1 Tax=Motiliproteus sp. MSK22-1 TaxID=1897630 RepID=UPI000975CE2E|nr:MerR family transcriptional regulator [Motiliproteus sp. MSK22-1]OMH38035.1 hypothetical protein BGP75_07055 [Motiliproteus sp. MSK22-1]
MNKHVNLTSSIEEVSRDTGIGKDTLRVWERRYGFPQPRRGKKGERLYPKEQLDRLRSISRLLDQGCRPGSIVSMSPEQLDILAEQLKTVKDHRDNPKVDEMVGALGEGRTQEVLQSLRVMLKQQGPQLFTYDIAAPLLEQIGHAWANGQLSIYMEHLITNHLGNMLNEATNEFSHIEDDLKILLTTLPGERHGMGLLMVELLLRAEGVETINLGVETPVDQLVEACIGLNPQVLALSFSAIHKRASVIAVLRELSDKIPVSVILLAGGEGISKLRSIPERIRVVKKLDTLGIEVRSIRQQLNKT